MFRLDLDSSRGDTTRVMLPHPEIIEASEIGHVLLVDDGKLKLTVSGKGQGYLDCTVNVGGKISNRKVRVICRILLYYLYVTSVIFFSNNGEDLCLYAMYRASTHQTLFWTLVH